MTNPVSVKDTNPKDAIGTSKVPLHLLSPIAKAHWACAQFAGMVKYGAWNWRAAGIRASVYIAAIQRHVDGIISGEEFDPVDNTRHEGNIMSCAAIMLDAKAAGIYIDDRPPMVNHRPTYAEVEAAMVEIKKRYAEMFPHHYTIHDTASIQAKRATTK
mgnify:FL=1